MPARLAIGIKEAHFPAISKISKRVTACTIPATGVRPPFFTFVAVRAMAPVAGIPPKMEREDIGNSLCYQFHVGAMVSTDHSIGHYG